MILNLVFSLSLIAQAPRTEGSVSAPLIGHFSSPDGTQVHGIFGVPAASDVKPSLLPEGAGRMFLAPGQAWAIARNAREEGLSVTGLDEPRLRPVAGSAACIDAIAFSPNGGFAAVYCGRRGQLQIVSARGRVVFEFETALDLQALAVNDAGTCVAVAEAGGSIHGYGCGESSPSLLFRANRVAGLTFLPGSTGLLIADGIRRTFTMLDVTARSTRTFASSFDGASLVMAPALDGRTVVGIVPGGRAVMTFDTVDDVVRWSEVPCEVQELSRLRNGDSYLVNSGGGGPAWWIVLRGQSASAVFSARNDE